MAAATSKVLDGAGLAHLWSKLKTALSGKADAETGKGLSANDYTTAEKTKLAGIERGAQVNAVNAVKVNGAALPPDSAGAVNIDLAPYATRAVVASALQRMQSTARADKAFHLGFYLDANGDLSYD